MNLLVAGATGWGKSYVTQSIVEENIGEYDATVLLDYKDEYRGLVKAGMARYWQVGDREASLFTQSTWQQMIEGNRNLVLARRPQLREDDWRQVCGEIVRAGRTSDLDILWVIDEAHFVAPQQGGYPDSIEGLATTGRGEGQSVGWVTQRLSRLDETVVSQCTARHLGGFESENDTGKVDPVLPYPASIHNSGGHRVAGDFPEEVLADGTESISVRKWKDDDTVTDSEWIYTDDSGTIDRWHSKQIDMDSEHIGAPGKEIQRPV